MCTYDLKYNDYFTNMSSGLSSLLATADIADVTLAVEGKFFKTHQVILSIFSPYFRELFATSPCKHPIFFMKDVKYQVMRDLLTFMYEGKVQITEDEFNDFVETAKALKVKGLTNMAEPEQVKQPNCEPVENSVIRKRPHDAPHADEGDAKVAPTAKKNKPAPMPPVPLLSEVSVLPVCARGGEPKKALAQDFCEIEMKEEQPAFIDEGKLQVELHLDPDDNGLQYDADGTIELDADDDESFDLLEPVAGVIDVPMSEPEGEPAIITLCKSYNTQKVNAIIWDDSRYMLRKTYRSWSSWLCGNASSRKCRARLILTCDRRLVVIDDHNHDKGRIKRNDCTNIQRTYYTLTLANWKATRNRYGRHRGHKMKSIEFM